MVGVRGGSLGIAGLDNVDLAQDCCTLAESYGGVPVEPWDGVNHIFSVSVPDSTAVYERSLLFGGTSGKVGSRKSRKRFGEMEREVYTRLPIVTFPVNGARMDAGSRCG